MTQTYEDWLADLQASIPQATVEEAAELNATIVDVREAEEYRQGHLPEAVHLSRSFLEMQALSKLPDREAPLLIYCAGGIRSLFAADSLRKLGFEQVTSLKGGFQAWRDAGFPVAQPPQLSDYDRQRYARHLAIPEVGEAGQLKLLGAKVLMIGTGGLGSPIAYYLAAAGVGHMTLVDGDTVEMSNLQRQILHTPERIGTAKTESALQTLTAFNDRLDIQTVNERFTSDNADDLVANFDLIVDGTDNFPTRYLINDACVKWGKPFVHGSVYRFEGQVSLFDPAKGGPCYRCLYPEPPPPELAPSCAEAGVLGVLPGIIGLLQAVEGLKYLLEIGTPLTGTMTAYDALTSRFTNYKLRKDPDCRYCAPGQPFPGYIDYAHYCSNPSSES
jgi:molybdopterin/thiamine biosynthesis adenylyltransferase/rhodanese-related sulfurtransferase